MIEITRDKLTGDLSISKSESKQEYFIGVMIESWTFSNKHEAIDKWRVLSDERIRQAKRDQLEGVNKILKIFRKEI